MSEGSEATKPFVYGAEDGPAHWFVNNRALVKASAEQTGGLFSLLEMRLGPEHSPPLHIHDREDESFWLLEGELLLKCGDEEFKAGPGSFIYLPRGIPHTFMIEGDVLPRLLVLLVPGGGERFFIEAGRPAEGPGFPPMAPPDFELMTKVSEKYHQRIIGPPLSQSH